jgi:hypothetical protein
VNPQSVDCSIVSSQSPCTFTDTFVNSDREAWDFSVGVDLPGVREAKFTSATSPPSIVTHADLYALGDFFPLAIVQHFTDWSAIAYMKTTETWVPHFNFGIPIASQPLGLAEPVTTWTKAQKHGFPLQINLFAGFVDLKQQVVRDVKGKPTLAYDWAWKPVFGIEVPVGSLASKLSSSLSGGGSKSSTTSGGKSGQ